MNTVVVQYSQLDALQFHSEQKMLLDLPRVAAREVMAQSAFCDLSQLVYLLWLTSTIQIWNWTPIFKTLLYLSHLCSMSLSHTCALWVILRRWCNCFSLVFLQPSLESLFYKYTDENNSSVSLNLQPNLGYLYFLYYFAIVSFEEKNGINYSSYSR